MSRLRLIHVTRGILIAVSSRRAGHEIIGRVGLEITGTSRRIAAVAAIRTVRLAVAPVGL